MIDALMFGHDHIKMLCEFQEQIIAKCAKPKMEIKLDVVPEEIKAEIDEKAKARLIEAVSIKLKLERYGKIDEITDEMAALFEAREYASEKIKDKTVKQVRAYCTEIVANEVRRLISEEKIRPDGRAVDELRPLNSQVDLLPRVHGSAMFTRGETQVMSACTLGALGDNQIIDDLTEIETKRFMHHYNFPPYSVGETGRMGSPGRRDRPWRAGRKSAVGGHSKRGRIPVHNPFSRGSAGIQRFLLPGFDLRRHDGADVRGRSDQGAGGRGSDGPDQDQRRTLHRADGYPGHGRSLWRHGLQGSRHAERHHRAADGHQDRRHQPRDPEEALAQAKRAALKSWRT